MFSKSLVNKPNQKLNEEVIKLQSENQELKDQQKELNHSLQTKVTELTNELKVERERRSEAEKLCTVNGLGLCENNHFAFRRALRSKYLN